MKLRYRTRPPLLECLLALAVLAAALPAQAALSLPDAVRRVFDDGTAHGAYARVAVGLIERGEEQTWFFGKDGPAADAQTAFEIGAVTDVFTGLLLAQAALDHKVRLDQPLGELLPEARGALASIPLVALATQNSGLPPTPANLFPDSSDDPYAQYADADLLYWLANAGSATSAAPGSYSVLNAGVLGLALGRAYGGDFRAVLRQKVLAPLALEHSGFDDSPELLPGHAFGQPVEHWHFVALAGAAGLRSTLTDLLQFARANLAPERSPLRAALLLARQGRAENATGSIGLGWNVGEVASDEQTWPLVWRASETGGFSTFIGFRTDRQQALVLLANSATELAPLGLAWLADKQIPAAPAAPYQPAAGQLQRYPGLYRLLNGSEVTISVAAGAVRAQLRGEPPVVLQPVAEDVFALSGGAFGITFVRNIDTISGLLLQTGDRFIAAERLSARAPQLERPRLTLAPAALEQYRGDYAMGPDRLVRVRAQQDGLEVQFTGAAPLPLRAYAPDRFTTEDGRTTLTFERNEAGRLAGATIDLAGGEHHLTPANWRATAADQPADARTSR